MHEHLTLPGCAPSPLAGYLKALGILRLVSSSANRVSGRAADPQARGWWADERFHLSTALHRGALRRFFLDEYAPTPILAPWNGGSGFYPKDNREGFGPLAAEEVAPRFQSLTRVIGQAVAIIESLGLKERPEGEAKQQLVARLRAELPDCSLGWLDAALALSGRDLRYPPLLGTGGNDGRLDFTNNFLRRLVSHNGSKAGLFDAQSGAARGEASGLLDAALFDSPAPQLLAAPIGQFAPGNAGGANATTGYQTKGAINPWDFILMLEGSVSFAGAATRRHEGSQSSSGSFPFTVRPTGAGSGVVSASDETDARAEFWAPLWRRPATQTEIQALLSEGRAVVAGRTARDGLDFARAAASLGVSRGFSEFERYGFFKRAGNQYLAAPLGRRAARPARGAELVADLDSGGWLSRVRGFGRAKGSPTSARQAIKRLEDAILDLVASEADAKPVEAALGALRDVAAWCASSPKHRAEVGAPPPGLSGAWLRQADDGSSEFRVAASLAGLGHRVPRAASDSKTAGGEHADAARAATDAAQGREKPTPPMAAHWAPIDEESFLAGRRRTWLATPRSPSVVWGAGPLVRNLGAVLERRLVEMSVRKLREKPLAGVAPARLVDIARFLAGDFDDARCASLLGGLIWVRPGQFSWRRERDTQETRRELPFAYAALKPIFSTDEALRRVKVLDPQARMPVPPGLVARLRNVHGGGRTGSIEDAVRSALARARGSGLSSPFGARFSTPATRLGGDLDADRLAAALLIPIHDAALKKLLERAYRCPKEDTDHDA